MFRMSRRNNILKKRFDQVKLNKLINVGSLPSLTTEEISAIEGHRKGDQSHLLEEKVIIHRRGVIITKTMSDNFDISEFVRNVIDACNCKFWINLGLDC